LTSSRPKLFDGLEDYREQAESQTRTLLDSIPQQIWSGPPDGTLDYCNDHWRSYMGLKLQQLQGDGWQRMLHPDDRGRVLAAWQKSVITDTPYEQEERHRGFDGKYRWFLARGLPFRDVSGHVLRWYGINTDVDDRKQAEQDLRRLATQLLRLQDDERRRIARGLHDSTGQDLVILANELSNLHSALSPSERKLRSIAFRCRVLAHRSSRELRTLSYLLHPPMLDKTGLVDAIQEYVDGFAQRSGIVVELLISPRLERMPPDVEIALFRVVQESLTNIQRHSGSRVARIRLDRDSEQITLEVRDAGHGIPRCDQRKTRSTSNFKVGVGIPSMRERVTAIGGRLDIKSSAKGTTLRVLIPQDN
jgi:PAS domain S-box-containing protein